MNALRNFSGNSRRGFSLLEVLVACGILVIGLASIAAILPAAGSRLGEASAQDRAVNAAAVAMSEIQCRGLVSRQLIPSGTWAGGSAYTPSAIIFGETLSLAVDNSAMSSGYAVTSGSLALTATSGSVALAAGGSTPVQALLSGTVPVLSIPVPTILNSRINNDTASADRRGFILEDEVQYLPSVTGDLPTNSFVDGVRQFNRGVCWGALITPSGTSWDTTTAAKVSVAVFKKPGAATAVALTAAPNLASEIFVTGSTTPVTLQRTILKPCSMVLAINGTASPQWLPIRSSWILTGTMIGTSGTFAGIDPGATLSSVIGHTCVTFTGTVPPSLISSGTLQVIGFENLLLVNEQTLPIQ
jgi:prepilin-type N-terminal cleavage/methylation domain-containing protein